MALNYDKEQHAEMNDHWRGYWPEAMARNSKRITDHRPRVKRFGLAFASEPNPMTSQRREFLRSWCESRTEPLSP